MAGLVRKRCTYASCDSPAESSQFFEIGEGTAVGGQDWSYLAGSVLCNACYMRFMRSGTLERTRNGPLAASARQCTYEHCDRPEESRDFFRIGEGTAAGGQDWSSLVGSVLCQACYKRFKRRGTLERTANRPLAASAQRCTYEHCDSPEESSQFHQIGEGKTSGGQDWSSLAGNVLCAAYFHRFKRRGTLHRCDSRPSKKQKTSRPPRQQPPANGTSIPADSSISDGESESSEQPEEEEIEEDKGECMVCLGEGRAMCIVPCGHFGLCGDCGDESLFEDVDISSSMKEGGGSSNSSSRRRSRRARGSSRRESQPDDENDEEEKQKKKKKKKRPFEVCPICCEEMCWPWVMTREEWVWMGGTVYDA